MKKPTAKLLVRRETLRELASVELTRAVGGGVIALYDTNDKYCPVAVSPPVMPPAG